MDSNKTDGCAIGCALLAGLVAFDYLIVIGLIWFICWCFSPLGLVFDIRLATGAWVLLHIVWYLINTIKK